MNELITLVNDALWGYVLIGTLVFCGLWFTWNTRGVQFRMIGEMFRLLTDCNLVAILALGKYAFRLLDDYRQQKRRGIKEPIFHRSQFPELSNEIDCWEEE